MAEAEDVITDVARHATVYIRRLWRRYTPSDADPTHLELVAVMPRIDALLTAVFGSSFALRVAQPPPLPTVLSRILQRHALPPSSMAVPATDGYSIWLPASFEMDEAPDVAATRFRTTALLQGMRTVRGSAQLYPAQAPLLFRELYLLLEARAAEEELGRLLPGLGPSLWTLRADYDHPPYLSIVICASDNEAETYRHCVSRQGFASDSLRAARPGDKRIAYASNNFVKTSIKRMSHGRRNRNAGYSPLEALAHGTSWVYGN